MNKDIKDKRTKIYEIVKKQELKLRLLFDKKLADRLLARRQPSATTSIYYLLLAIDYCIEQTHNKYSINHIQLEACGCLDFLFLFYQLMLRSIIKRVHKNIYLWVWQIF